ncbi:MAG: SDR family NAD(P)-dependent oxidoreductase [Erythrobacter sp.]
MTGGTSGFGAEAARRMAEAGHHLTIGARGSHADRATTRYLPLDLEDAASIDAFAEAVRRGPVIDALVLNAGLQLARPQRLANGIETTFFVNVLAHVRLLHRLLEDLAPGTRIILTGSGTHDPAEKTPVTPPEHADARRLAYPDTDPTLPQAPRKQAFRAYSSSKLACIMVARHLATLRPDLSVMSFDPGYVPWTGLGRSNHPIIAALVSLILPRTMARDRSSTVPLSGGYLAELATSPGHAGEHGTYWSVRKPNLVAIQPSPLARDDAAAARLWEDSLAILGFG